MSIITPLPGPDIFGAHIYAESTGNPDIIAAAPLSYDIDLATLSIPPASLTAGGYLSHTAQTFGGVKTFNSLPVCSVAPLGNSDLANKLYVDTRVATGIVWKQPVDSYADVSLILAPVNGERHIQTSTVGGYTKNDIYEYSTVSLGWIEYVPLEGWACYLDNLDKCQLYVVTGGVGSWGDFIVSLAPDAVVNNIKINDTTQATSTSTGALICAGGGSFAQDIVVANKATILGTSTQLALNYSSTASATLQCNAAGTLIAAEPVFINNASTAVPGNTTTGALQVLGGASIASNLAIASTSIATLADTASGALNVAGGLRIRAGPIVCQYPAATYQALLAYNSTAYTTFLVNNAGNMTIDCQGNNLNLSSTDMVHILNTTAATSTSTGAFTVAGGCGIADSIFMGGNLNILSTTASTSTSTGALICAGGVAIAGTTSMAGPIKMNTSGVSTIPDYTMFSGVPNGGAVAIGDITTNGNIIVCIPLATYGQNPYYSTDGINWSISGFVATATSLTGISYNWNTGIFCMVGFAGVQGYSYTSSDGLNWIEYLQPYIYERKLICDGVYFHSCLSSGTGGCLYSPDGINWTLAAGDKLGFGNDLDIDISTNTILVNSTGSASNGTDINRSTDSGRTYTKLIGVLPADYWRGMSYGGGIWICVGSAGNIMRSTNAGASWTPVAATGIVLTQAYYYNPRGRDFPGGSWVVVANSSGATALQTSEDNGLNWTGRLNPSIQNLAITEWRGWLILGRGPQDPKYVKIQSHSLNVIGSANITGAVSSGSVQAGQIVIDGWNSSNSTSTGSLIVQGDSQFAGVVNISSSTESTSSTTGAVILSGGLGLAKNIYAGGNINSAARVQGATGYFTSTTASTSTSTGALICLGGAGIASNINSGGTIAARIGAFNNTSDSREPIPNMVGIDIPTANGNAWTCCAASPSAIVAFANGQANALRVEYPCSTSVAITLGAQTWISVVYCGQTAYNAVFIAVALDGTIIQSLDDGVNWSAMTNPFPASVLVSVAYGEGIAIAVATGAPATTGMILRCYNGLTSWAGITTLANYAFSCVAFCHGSFYAHAGGGNILRSDDLGLTWALAGTCAGSNVIDIQPITYYSFNLPVNAIIALYSGGGAHYAYSTNRGALWADIGAEVLTRYRGISSNGVCLFPTNRATNSILALKSGYQIYLQSTFADTLYVCLAECSGTIVMFRTGYMGIVPGYTGAMTCAGNARVGSELSTRSLVVRDGMRLVNDVKANYPLVIDGGVRHQRRFQDLQLIGIIRPGGTAPAFTQIDTTGTYAYLMAAGDKVYCNAQMPHGATGRIRPHVHFMPQNAGNISNITWTLRLDVYPGITGTGAIKYNSVDLAGVFTGAVALSTKYLSWDWVDLGSTYLPSGLLMICLTLKTYTNDGGGDVFLTGFDLHYETDREGTMTELADD